MLLALSVLWGRRQGRGQAGTARAVTLPSVPRPAEPAAPSQPPVHLQSDRTWGRGTCRFFLALGWAPAPSPRPPQCSGERRARQMAWLRMRRRCREVRAGTGDMRLRALWCHRGGGGGGPVRCSPHPPCWPPVLTSSSPLGFSLTGLPCAGPRPHPKIGGHLPIAPGLI